MPLFIRNYVALAGVIVTVLTVALMPASSFASFKGQEALIMGSLAVFFGALTLVIYYHTKTVVPIVGSIVATTGLGILPFGAGQTAAAVLLAVGFVALLIRERYPRDHRPDFWSVYVCMLAPFSGLVLLQYLLATDRSAFAAAFVSVIGTVVAFRLASSGQRRYMNEVQA